MPERGIVIVGAGEAGARVALELRERGWNGAVTLIGKEKRAPYERPPLSKEALTAEEAPPVKTIVTRERLREKEIGFIEGCAAERIDRERRVVRLADGREIFYEKLVLATGAKPRRLASDAYDTSSFLYLRT